MTKTLNQIILFSSTKIRIFFSATLGIRIFFGKKKISWWFSRLHIMWIGHCNVGKTNRLKQHGTENIWCRQNMNMQKVVTYIINREIMHNLGYFLWSTSCFTIFGYVGHCNVGKTNRLKQHGTENIWCRQNMNRKKCVYFDNDPN
jgi:hypothetical protein